MPIITHSKFAKALWPGIKRYYEEACGITMATNYDLFITDTKDIFLYLSGNYYCLTEPDGESHARKSINVSKYGPAEPFRNVQHSNDLREIFLQVKRKLTESGVDTN